jgi:ubiquinol-cytochrome c reductase cytochrome b subunit
VLRLLGSDGGSIGAVTFARFYAAHVLLLPPLTMLLIAIHVYLVRRHGVTPIEADAQLPKKKFYPEQVFKDTVATFLWFAVLAAMAIAVRVPLGHVADPTDTSYIPRPEWYFLFLFQTLKAFEGPLEIVGAVVLPTLAILALFLVPFIDRGKVLRIRQRTGAIALIVLCVLGWTALTARAIATTPPSTESADAGLAQVEAWQELPPDQLAAIGAFRKDNCASCHVLGKSGAGPDLTRAASQRPTDWLMQHFKQPAPNVATQLKNPELRGLVAFVTKRTDSGVKAWLGAPQAAVEGAMVYQSNQCGACHKLNGVGMQTGPPLNGVADHHNREWIEGHFADPPKFSAGSTMPAYKLSSRDLDRLTAYIMEIPM